MQQLKLYYIIISNYIAKKSLNIEVNDSTIQKLFHLSTILKISEKYVIKKYCVLHKALYTE